MAELSYESLQAKYEVFKTELDGLKKLMAELEVQHTLIYSCQCDNQTWKVEIYRDSFFITCLACNLKYKLLIGFHAVKV